MIFVTVGTHEQSFTRLIKYIDDLVGQKKINEEVFIQTGYTEYKPKNCSFKSMITNEEMINNTREARIIITHGGPGSIMLPFQYGKIPIVVPRQREFNEHVDNHQVKFTNKLEEEKKVIPIYNIEDLYKIIKNYDILIKSYNNNYQSNTSSFVKKLEDICTTLLEK
ncbi:glycosyltransferase [Clostridium perfringens]|uniref:glycosyltransferase n=1 Tax=Clostridium perfringens TaxID=1502 RepID=UPI000D967F99|nr:glycosyltransferase [Clostridium perfringens]MDM0859157.1 glycosyltransferase [Clostridium perfringens]SQB38910.1 glycosyltransferase family 28 protein [Clostridium perfringens]